MRNAAEEWLGGPNWAEQRWSTVLALQPGLRAPDDHGVVRQAASQHVPSAKRDATQRAASHCCMRTKAPTNGCRAHEAQSHRILTIACSPPVARKLNFSD